MTMTPCWSDLCHGDCLAEMAKLPDGCVDMVLTDPPYGTTACKWDTVIPFEPMWAQLKRLTKKNAAIVLHACQPFTSELVISNMKMFRYEWVWIKNTQTGLLSAGKMPMKKHESIVVFCKGSHMMFNEKKVLGSFISQNHSKKGYEYKNKISSLYNVEGGTDFKWSEFIHANSVLLCNVVGNRDKTRCHPTQKPVALAEYLIKTYTNPGDTVLDFTMGSGTTGVACKRLGRNFIGIELDVGYFEIAKKRIAEAEIIVDADADPSTLPNHQSPIGPTEDRKENAHMSQIDRNNLIAAKLRELADLFHGVAQGAGPGPEDTPADEQTDKPKRGRPAKAEKQPEPPPADEAPPVEDDKTVTADHPKRAELLAAAKKLAAMTDRATAQKAVKLFGENTSLVPDAELVGALAHINGIISKKSKAAPAVEDDSI